MSKEQVVVARKKKKKVKIFPIVNVILFLVISLIIMVPLEGYRRFIRCKSRLWYEFPATDIYTRWL